jgi:hypothetical protein
MTAIVLHLMLPLTVVTEAEEAGDPVSDVTSWRRSSA